MQHNTHTESMEPGKPPGPGPGARIAWARCRQVMTVGFVVITTTILIQNIAYPAWVEDWHKTFRALTGSAIFFIGFSVARILFTLYAEEIRAIRASHAAAAPAGNDQNHKTDTEQSNVSYDNLSDATASVSANETNDADSLGSHEPDTPKP